MARSYRHGRAALKAGKLDSCPNGRKCNMCFGYRQLKSAKASKGAKKADAAIAEFLNRDLEAAAGLVALGERELYGAAW